MLDVFAVLPAELSALGFHVPDEQLGLAVSGPTWTLMVSDVDQCCDPYGFTGILKTADGVDLRKIKWPMTFWFTDDVDEVMPYGDTFEEWVESHADHDWFFEFPKVIGYRDLPWNEHQTCGCNGDVDPDSMFLWDLWPVSEAVIQEVDALGMVLWDEFFGPVQEWVMLSENGYDPTDKDCRDRERQLHHQLFRPDGLLKVHSQEFVLTELTDNEDLIHAWKWLRRSSHMNTRICDRYRGKPFQTNLIRS